MEKENFATKIERKGGLERVFALFLEMEHMDVFQFTSMHRAQVKAFVCSAGPPLAICLDRPADHGAEPTPPPSVRLTI